MGGGLGIDILVLSDRNAGLSEVERFSIVDLVCLRRKTTMNTGSKKTLAIVAGALAFAFGGGSVRAEFYLRPVAQYSILTGSGSDSTGALGGGLSLGSAFGREHRFDVGAELLFTRYKGTYNEPTAVAYYGVPGSLSSGTPIAWKKVSASYNVTNALAAFRYSFLEQNAPVRPFIGCVLGLSNINILKTGAEDSGVSVTGGLGGGASFRLGQRTRLNVGYRYVFSSETSAIFTDATFHYNAHVLSVSLDQRF